MRPDSVVLVRPAALGPRGRLQDSQGIDEAVVAHLEALSLALPLIDLE